jgi:thioredoxin-related protein
MKMTGIVLFCVIISFTLGCTKKPIEPESISLPPTSSPSSEIQTTAKTEATPVTINEPTQTNNLVWMTDFAEAQKKAAAEGKDLFINFTGSDWCVWCQRLDKEVFSKKVFIYEAQKHFVFVMVDFPRDKPQSDQLKEQNEKLSQRYDASAFPTIILAEANGRPYAQTGYLEGGPLVYMHELARLQLQKRAK